MPFASRAQQRWGNSPAGVSALGGKAKVGEWNAATNFDKLPERKTGVDRDGILTAAAKNSAPAKQDAGKEAHPKKTRGLLARRFGSGGK